MEKFINVIYQINLNLGDIFELQYINEVLLKNIKYNNYYDNGKLITVKILPLIIYSNDLRKISEEFSRYLEKNSDYILYHLSNETLKHDTKYYEKAKLVFRSYYDPNINSNKVYTLPLGFKSGFLNLNKSEETLHKREIIWTFFGQIKSHRKNMIERFKNLDPNCVHITSSWESNDQKSVADIITIYTNTIFVPCPFGNINPDSYRIMECLECGCIPVVIKFYGIDYYKYIFGDHPFIIHDSWEQCIQEIEYLLGNNEILKIRQNEVFQWYKNYIENLTSDVSTLINGHSQELKSVQFGYQQQGKKDFVLRFKFFLFLIIEAIKSRIKHLKTI